ncbi:MAG: polyprenol phosphomannose-dependent alpha 1,6 mannosyltransferase MptB [Frankiales bacterium]|nr:polyprenol phosphomannose-dependent alpha 1,6 mannosyltransferase MptB [Frankiales bacterium]
MLPTPAGALLRVRSCPLATSALLGTIAVAVLVGAAGRAPVPLGVVLPSSFFGLLDPASGGGTASAVLVLLSLAVLVGAWWQVLARVARREVGMKAVVLTLALWLAPVLLAPPLLSMDGYAYLAQGRMLLEGLDPYSGGPVLMGGGAAAARVDPMWRASPVPYGPIALALLRAVALAGDNLVAGVLLLRLLVIVGVAAAVAVALAMVEPHRRAYVLTLCALNPITIVHLVGGVHLDAVLAGLCSLSVLALLRGRLWVAWVLATAAVAVKVTVAPLLLFVLLALHARGSRLRTVLPVAAALAVLPLLAAGTAVDRPWGFLLALLVPGSAAPLYAPATVVGAVLTGVADLLRLPLDERVPLLLGRLVVLALGAVFVLCQVRAQWRHRGPADPAATTLRIGSALLVTGLCLPALYGWYLAAGLFLLATTRTLRWTTTLVLLSSALLFTSMPPLYDVSRWPLVLAWAVVLIGLGGVAWRLRRPVGAAGKTAGRTSAGIALSDGKHLLRLSGLARLAGVVLLAGIGVGGLTPKEVDASPARLRTVQEQVMLVAQFGSQYPGLQIATIVRSELDQTGPAVYQVELVEPGVRLCQLRVRQTVGPLSPFRRLPDSLSGRTLRAVEQRTCPAPKTVVSDVPS